jgi:acetyltransferase-like isoleucine patch superfamily enzyme
MKKLILKLVNKLAQRVKSTISKANAVYWQERALEVSNEKVFFKGEGEITAIEKVQFESNIHIGKGFFIRAEGGLRIGENTHIARNLTLYTHNHQYQGQLLPYDQEKVYKAVKIGRNVWIGINVTILPGANIGDGSIIGAGSVVYGEIPPLSIVGAASFSNLKKRDEEHYKTLDEHNKYGGHDGAEI